METQQKFSGRFELIPVRPERKFDFRVFLLLALFFLIGLSLGLAIEANGWFS